MKVLMNHKNSDVPKKYYSFYDKFVEFIYKHYPLKKDIEIIFLKKRNGKMSTGSRSIKNEIKVLTGERLNRDILRTLAHEWIHEYQRTILKRERGPDIGGKNEDEANAFAGQLLKKFEKKYPYLEKKMYQ